MATKGELLYEGKAKQIYQTDNPEQVIIHYKDTATAFNGKKKEDIKGKGILNNAISNIFFKQLEKKEIPTHLIEVLNDREILAKKLDIIPLEVVVRNIIAGSLAKRTGLKEGTQIEGMVNEFYYKKDELGDPMINISHIKLLNLATEQEVVKLRNLSRNINQHLRGLLRNRGILLVDMKLEFGRFGDQIILGDEISPDTCRFWDAETNKILDKDRFRNDMGELIESYQEVFDRLKQLEGSNDKS